jgi:2,4-dienoyl-CoA reductase-like NADH-dependent reductase (Old Yellow Enzyme family)
MALLFTPIRFRELEIKNRIFVSPMCMYSAIAGLPNHWHLVHLGSRAVGGAGLVMTEATAVTPEGRISEQDLGIWNDEQAEGFVPIVKFIKEQNSVAGIQLAHAGRKAKVPGSVGPSPLAFSHNYKVPHELTLLEMARITNEFVHATARSLKAGFQVVEIHMAHGYLLHEYLSPLSNHRTDDYGGSLENRMRFPLEVAEAVRKAWPQNMPVFVRISATDWVKTGWDLFESVELAKKLKALGIDLVDCSTGGNVPDAKIPVGPNYQVPFAEEIRKEAQIATGAVGMITSGLQAEKILEQDQADAVFLARELLRDPYFPLRAAKELGVDIAWPVQYERAKE